MPTRAPGWGLGLLDGVLGPPDGTPGLKDVVHSLRIGSMAQDGVDGPRMGNIAPGWGTGSRDRVHGLRLGYIAIKDEVQGYFLRDWTPS